MSRTFVIGDIHGAYRALKQCLEKSSFDYGNDLLICLGDVCDGWPDVYKSIEELLKINHLVYILGNHDNWALEWFTNGITPEIWLSQGGWSTIQSYKNNIPERHINLLKSANLYYVLNNKLFVHGGFLWDTKITEQDKSVFLWNRSLVIKALNSQNQSEKVTCYDEVYVGHTPTLNFGSELPVKACEVYLMDTGAGWPGGVLTMMNTESKEYYASGRVDVLYPGKSGRR